MNAFDRRSLDEQQRRVSRYVAGDLSRSERAEFEAWLVASPELASEVEMERRLRRGMASAARRGWLNRGAASHAAVRENRWRMAIAASLVVALGSFTLGFVLPESRNSTTETSASAQTRRSAPLTVRLGVVRGLGGTPDVAIDRSNAPSELNIQPDVVVYTCPNGSLELECAGGSTPQTPQYAEYEVELVNRHGSVLAWRSGRRLAVAGAPLSFVMDDPGKLAAGDYELQVRGHATDHDEVVARFWLQVTER